MDNRVKVADTLHAWSENSPDRDFFFGDEDTTVFSMMQDTCADGARVIRELVAELEAARASDTGRSEAEAIRAEMPESLNTGNLVYDVRTLRWAYDARKSTSERWGRGLKLLLAFVDMAAGEGILFMATSETPKMDAADICAAFAAVMGCDLGDDAYLAMVADGQKAVTEIRELNPPTGQGERT